MAKAKELAAPTGLTLADIANDKQTIEQWLLENEGEVDPAIEALMADNDTAAEKKITAVAAHIQDQDELAEALKRRAVSYSDRARAIVNRNEWFKNGYVARLLVQLNRTLGGERIADDVAVVRVQLNNPKLMPAEFSDELVEKMYGDEAIAQMQWQTQAVLDPSLPRPKQYVTQRISYIVDREALLRDAKLDPRLLPKGVTIVRDASVRLA